MSADQGMASSERGSTEKGTGVSHEPRAPEIKAMPKNVAGNDPDEALKLVTAHAGETIVLSAEEQAKLLKKIDFHMMPLLCVVYGLNYLDKTTLSYASIMGLKTDLNIGGMVYPQLQTPRTDHSDRI
ncbi:putative MFS allantoate transporter [Rosellinia necatrix]|uniref:Putative MFS allantoate transporter n=1 Tax=Rosellinia necatrix TaxID=77044 RepID=A0A1S8A5A2_ROSNE|nr:putative MFS allantoate transporter [Rosellinia necatrix]